MQRFTEKIVNMMKAEKLFESQGGPIILSQVCLYAKFHIGSFSFINSFPVINSKSFKTS